MNTSPMMLVAANTLPSRRAATLNIVEPATAGTLVAANVPVRGS